MTSNSDSMSSAIGRDSAAEGHYANQHPDYLWWAKTPGFHPLKAVAVIAGFAIFPPLGVAALVYFIWNARRGYWGHGPYAYRMAGGPQGGQGSGPYGRGRCGGRGGRGRGWSGNTAFDEHSEKVLNDLEQERQDFAAAREAERRKHDQEAFEAFKASRGGKPGDTPTTL